MSYTSEVEFTIKLTAQVTTYSDDYKEAYSDAIEYGKEDIIEALGFTTEDTILGHVSFIDAKVISSEPNIDEDRDKYPDNW